MDKLLQEFENRPSHSPHGRKRGQEAGLEFSAGPQGQVLILSHREKREKTLIRDVEQELHIAKSVTSNLIKRMEKWLYLFRG